MCNTHFPTFFFVVNLNENERGGGGEEGSKHWGNIKKLLANGGFFFNTSFSILFSVVNFNENARGGGGGRVENVEEKTKKFTNGE